MGNTQVTELVNRVNGELPTSPTPPETRKVTMGDFLTETKPITMDSFYPEGNTPQKGTKGKITNKNPNHKYTPQVGTEGWRIHQATLTLLAEGKSITVAGVYALMVAAGTAPYNGKSRLQGHFSWMVRHGYALRTAKGEFTLI